MKNGRGQHQRQPRDHGRAEQQADETGAGIQLAGPDREQHEERGDHVREVPRGPRLGRVPDDRPEREHQREHDGRAPRRAHPTQQRVHDHDVRGAEQDRRPRLVEAGPEEQHDRQEDEGGHRRVDDECQPVERDQLVQIPTASRSGRADRAGRHRRAARSSRAAPPGRCSARRRPPRPGRTGPPG